MSKTTLLIVLAASALIMGLAYYMRITQPVSPEKAQQMLKEEKRVIIDVRTPEEYNGGHLTEATNVPKSEIEVRISSVVPDKKTPVLLYCRSGQRSGAVMQVLKHLGYQNVANLGSLEQARQIVEDAGHAVH